MQDNIIYKNYKIDALLQNSNFIEKEENDNDILENLKNYTFSTKKLVQYSKFVETKIDKNRHNVNSVFKHLKNQNVFFSRYKDTLFWCFYVLHVGFDKYEMLGNHYYAEEKKIKFNMIDLIRSKKELLKTHKIKPLSELEDDLANKDNITLKTFIALCILSNLNIILVDKHKYFQSINSDDSNIHIIHKSIEAPTKYYIDMLPTIEKITFFRENYYNMPSLENKLKSISSYKYGDLLSMCKKLGIEISNENKKKKTKAELYEIITFNL